MDGPRKKVSFKDEVQVQFTDVLDLTGHKGPVQHPVDPSEAELVMTRKRITVDLNNLAKKGNPSYIRHACFSQVDETNPKAQQMTLLNV